MYHKNCTFSSQIKTVLHVLPFYRNGALYTFVSLLVLTRSIYWFLLVLHKDPTQVSFIARINKQRKIIYGEMIL